MLLKKERTHFIEKKLLLSKHVRSSFLQYFEFITPQIDISDHFEGDLQERIRNIKDHLVQEA